MPEEATLHGAMAVVRNLAFAPDGKTLAAGMRTWDGRGDQAEEVVKLYDMATLSERLRFRAAEDYVSISPPGHRSTNRVHALAYAPDGRALATGDDRMLALWDARTGRRLAAFPDPKELILALAFAPDSKSLVISVTIAEPTIYDIATGAKRLPLQGHKASRGGHLYWIRALAYAPDGKSIATTTTGSADNAVRLCDATDGRLLWTTAATGSFYSVAFAPDGKTIAGGTSASTTTTTDCAVRLYDAATGRERAALMGHDRQVCALAFTPDSQALLSLGRGGDLRLWDVATGRERASFGRPFLGPECMALSPDGKMVALGGCYRDRRFGVITLLEIDKNGFRLRKPGP